MRRLMDGPLFVTAPHSNQCQCARSTDGVNSPGTLTGTFERGQGSARDRTAAAKKVHILVKPTRPELITNLVINTDRRTYHLELRSTEKTYMASVSWMYPQDELIALRRQNVAADAAAPVAALDITNLHFRYAIEGDNPPWRPLRAFDDGRKVYIEFPPGIAQGETPPLFIIGPEGRTSELVNYRVRGNHMIVDRLFAAAELRLGDAGSERRVRIVRTDRRLFW
jgi:type IV secretion system protein TrbG